MRPVQIAQLMLGGAGVVLLVIGAHLAVGSFGAALTAGVLCLAGAWLLGDEGG